MDHTLIITAANLEEYADTRDSQHVIPELIYQLVKESIPDGSICRIPYGAAVNQPGADGLVVTSAAYREFVPQGKSYWETSVGDPQARATENYAKRTTNPDTRLPEDERADSTFVFVTPRSTPWPEPKQTNWLNRRKKNVTVQVPLPNETKVLLIRIAYLAERATKNLSALHFLLDSAFLLCYLFWPWKKSWSYRDER